MTIYAKAIEEAIGKTSIILYRNSDGLAVDFITVPEPNLKLVAAINLPESRDLLARSGLEEGCFHWGVIAR